MEIKYFDTTKKCDKLTKINLETYLSASSELELLKKVIIDPFEIALKDSIKYDENNIPGKKLDLEKSVGRYKFNIEVKPNTTAAYANVFNDISNYTTGLIKGVEQNKRREGIRTIDSKPHVLLDDLVDVMNQSLRNNTKMDVSKKIKQKSEVEVTDKFFSIDIEANYSNLVDSNARTYLECKTQSSRIKEYIASPFEKAVKGKIGFTKDNIPSEVTYSKFSLGNALIYGVSSKADNIKYAKIVDDMIDFVESPDNVRISDGKEFMNIKLFNKKLDKFKEMRTADSLRQSISYLRLPKADTYVIE